MTTAAQIESAIHRGARAFVELLDSTLMSQCVEYMNEKFVFPLMSKLPSERLPTHQRNLTDARTRIGVLLEYSFALALQNALQGNNATSYRISYVVANRYPDLVIRDASSEPVLRFEVKTLQLASEEKSANFDALVRDIHPERDILCVLLWEWRDRDLGDVPVNFPEVRRGFAFEAYPVALGRDLGWLAQRPPNLVKGIDLTGPVVGSAASLRKEEHNMGKLMRILGDDEVGALPKELAEHNAVEAYRDFKNFTISAGLAHNAARFLGELGIVIREPSGFVHSATSIQIIAHGSIGNTGREVVVGAGGRLTAGRLALFERELQLAGFSPGMILIFNEKFFWSVYHYDGIKLTKIDGGKKFERALEKAQSLLDI
jgi:hypothetical protein